MNGLYSIRPAQQQAVLLFQPDGIPLYHSRNIGYQINGLGRYGEWRGWHTHFKKLSIRIVLRIYLRTPHTPRSIRKTPLQYHPQNRIRKAKRT